MTAHTPGPWSYYVNRHPTTRGERWGWVSHDPIGKGNLPGASCTWEGRAGEANARLIAAAPELYDSLRSIVEWANGPQPRNTIEDLLMRAEKVLAKATGGRP